jgi:hypothetical protein
MSRYSKLHYPPLPKLNSSEFEWDTDPVGPPPTQIADTSVAAENVPGSKQRSLEVHPRQKLTYDHIMRRKAP